MTQDDPERSGRKNKLLKGTVTTPFFQLGKFPRRAEGSLVQVQGPDISKPGDTPELPYSYRREERRYNPTAHHSRRIPGSCGDQSDAVSISGSPCPKRAILSTRGTDKATPIVTAHRRHSPSHPTTATV